MDLISSPFPRPPARKRQQVAQSLRQMVASLTAGDRLPSVTALEKYFGVGKSTVEAAVSELQKEGLLIRRHGSGTYVREPVLPATDAARPGLPRTGRVLITSSNFGSAVNILSAVAGALVAELARVGYDPVMLIEGSPEQRLVQVKARCAAGSADGYVHLGSIGGDLTFPAVPGVVLGEMPEGASVHQVVVDSYGGGRTAGAYLWDMGHRRVAFLAVKGLIPAAARFRGLAAVLRERAGEQNESATALESYVALEKSDSPVLEAELRRLLDLPAPPTAFFFGNDHTAFSALQTLLAWGVRVPGDVSLVSFDDTPGLASQTRPALTALRMPILSLASLTVQTLHQAIQEPDLPFRRLHLPAELILRESSGPPPGR